jgi:hypothetical protein
MQHPGDNGGGDGLGVWFTAQQVTRQLRILQVE